MSKSEDLEAKIRKVVDLVGSLRRENEHLRTERDSLKSQVTILSTENSKAQKILTDHDQLRRKHEQVTHRIEKALGTLNTLRSS